MNENYFKKIDTKEKAYCLGLFFGASSNEIKTGNLKISFNLEDDNILKFLHQEIFNSEKIYNYQKSNKLTYFKINNKKISNDLFKLGLKENKYEFNFPCIDDKLINYFLRGFFDKNGYISFTKTNACSLGITFNSEFILKISKIFKEKFDIDSYCSNKPNNKVFLRISGNRQICDILQWMYNDNFIYNIEKFKLFKQLLEQNANTIYYNKINLTEEWLIEQYVNKKLSVRQIASLAKCGKESVRQYLIKFDIKRRAIDEFMKSGEEHPNFGKTHSEEAKAHFAMKSRELMNRPEIKEKFSKMYKGNGNPNWKGGISKIGHLIRSSNKNIEWKKAVFKRDNYTCLECREKSGKIEADHIIPFSKILKDNNITTLEDGEKCESLWNINNGRTLCKSCHMKTDTYGTKAITKYSKAI